MLGAPTELEVSYTGTPNYGYYGSWYKDGVRITTPSTTFEDIEIDAITYADEGTYTFRLEDDNNGDSNCYLEESVKIAISEVAVDLASANPLCSDYTYDFPLQTDITAEVGPDYGCLATIPNPAWYYLKIAISGDIFMDLNAPNDVDYIIWGPFDYIVTDPYELTSSTHVNCSYSGSAQEYPEILNAQADKYYMMLVTNFANQEQNFSLQQTGRTSKTNC